MIPFTESIHRREWPACSSSTSDNAGGLRIKQLCPPHVFFWYSVRPRGHPQQLMWDTVESFLEIEKSKMHTAVLLSMFLQEDTDSMDSIYGAAVLHKAALVK
ncbi:hypothetical protein NECAME_17366 [Necator americanus]|uniref:Uncharacterized protein n=1 Tax=Necator americanus TaxID=51031 RepID=W2TNM0_NECAM|nr:hypothetical protein NECAME_17366 [Necator americanus]ETN83700.1 hypothetical protein NECAME_17366 [Necator americanus]